MATQKSTYFPAYGGATSEQGLAQDLVDEHIKIHGSTVYYLPRTLNNVDNLFHEATTSSFTSAVQIEMYMKSYDKFDGLQDDTITQFGLRNNDALTFVVSKRRWQEEFDGNFAGQLADDRPAEGDLIYFPLTKGLFEIKYVEHQTDMYQLGDFYSYELRCELFEFADEEIETGVAEIDAIELEQAAAIKLIMDPGGTGDFTVGEEVVGDLFLARATATTSYPRKLVVGARLEDTTPTLNQGAVYVYDFDGTNEVKITASDAENSDYFGSSVATNGAKIIVGSYRDNTHGSDSGAAYIYNIDGTGEIKLVPSDLGAGDEFGFGVAMGNGKIAIGARRHNVSGQSNVGAVYVYNSDGSNQIKITPNDVSSFKFFGDSVYIGDNKLVVGAPEESSGRGSVYVYDLDGTFANELKITASDASSNTDFGKTVAIANNKIVVGAPEKDNPTNSGAVYVYDLDGTNEVKITASDAESYDNFGYSVAVGNNKIAVGSLFEDAMGTSSGSAYIYDLDGTNELKITASDGDVGDYFGRSVAISDSKLFVSAQDSSRGSAGAVYVYDLDGTNEIKIIASDAADGDAFGHKVAAAVDTSTISVVGSTITDGGEHYKTALPPTVTFSAPPSGTTATGTATVSAAGLVTGITITNPGSGYTTAPTITIDYSPKDNRAEVKSWNSSTRELQVINRTGVFNTAEIVTGLTSGARWSPESFDQTLALNNTNSTYDQSLTIETESDNIIDFTEVNPFGEF